MKCILLAAGYATRLYPLTKDKPKSLLTVNHKTILEHILRKIEKVESVDMIYIVSNARFYEQFDSWVDHYISSKPIKVINDQTTDPENRLGAIADIQFAIEQENIDEDILVVAGDNIFDFELSDFVQFYKEVNCDCLTIHALNDRSALQKTGVVSIDDSNQILSFEEKPELPKSNLAAPPFYIYRSDTLKLINKYLAEGNNPDAPGYFIPWLICFKKMYAYRFEGRRYDIGTIESYREVQRIFNT